MKDKFSRSIFDQLQNLATNVLKVCLMQMSALYFWNSDVNTFNDLDDIQNNRLAH